MSNALAVSPNEQKIRLSIARLEAVLREEPQVECTLRHTFTEGLYCREIFIPAGSMIVGKIHRYEHMNFITKGRVTVLTKDGLKELVGPCTMVSSAGTKRALYAHEDTIWTVIHANPNNETDLAKIEEMVIAPDYAALEHETITVIGHLADTGES